MQLYRIFDSALGEPGSPECSRIDWQPTQIDAQKAAQGWSTVALPDMRVELVEVPTDKYAVIALLKGDQSAVKVLKTWRLTERGALHDIENGE